MRSVTVLAALLSVQAAPAAKLHQLQMVKRDQISLPYFYPDSAYISKTVTPGASMAPMSKDEITKLAKSTLVKEFKVKEAEIQVVNQFTDRAGVTHVYVDRLVNGVPITNQNAAVHIKNGQVSSFSSSFHSKANNLVASSTKEPTVVVSLAEAAKTAESKLGAPKDDVEATLAYVQIPSGDLVYAHQFQVRDDKASKWYHVSVDAQNGQIVEVVDYYNKASYNAITLPNITPLDGFHTVVDPADKVASPFGWNSDGSKSYTDTEGNNVDVSIGGGWFGKTYRPSSATLDFTSTWKAGEEPNSPANKQASATNLFYLINSIHDISYQYGFTEAAGNFQNTNSAKGGAGSDRVIANDISTSGTNNANFATPPDGQSGVMNMYKFTMTTPNRDGSLDAVIPLHEYTHGISNRLTGGSRNGQCLQNSEAGGMGEGWSDAVGVYLTRNANETRATNVAVGWYVLNTPSTGNGIRQYAYSTDMTVNPHVFADIAKSAEVHNVGEIWATMLYDLYWNLVDKHGFSANYYDAKQSEGNIVAMQILIGGLMRQPCNPNFTQARDAILKADDDFYAGANKCDIWKAFAKRGLGFDSVQKTHSNGFALPSGC